MEHRAATVDLSPKSDTMSEVAVHVIYNWAGNVELGDICIARYTIVSMCTAFPDLVTIIANNCVARFNRRNWSLK